MNIESDVLLVLTASVNVNAMPGATRVEPALREDDYAKALDYYLRDHPRFRRLLYVENSGWPLDRLRAVATGAGRADDVEFVSFDCNVFPRQLGKSYGEMLLLEKGLAVSTFARDAKIFAKLTGRTILTNATEILADAPADIDLFCDLRDHPFYDWLRLPYAGHFSDTRFVAFSRRFWDAALVNKLDRLDESKGLFLENLFYDVAKNPPAGMNVVRRFQREPDFRGLAGHFNKDYGSARERWKRRLRGASRVVLPWLKV